MRQTLVVANWKMNGSLEANELLVRNILSLPSNVERIVCPPSVYLNQVQTLVKGSDIKVGAQNIDWRGSGAFTGEISATMLADMGIAHVIIGHSERRALFGETDESCVKKSIAALEAGVTPIFCVGETKQQRDAGETQDVIEAQLAEAIRQLPLEKIVIAYEPVWAIGTGDVATPDQAASVHQQIRTLVAAKNEGAAMNMQILYGGSVNAGNAKGLFEQDDIDGALVGGASLKAEEFSAICCAARV